MPSPSRAAEITVLPGGATVYAQIVTLDQGGACVTVLSEDATLTVPSGCIVTFTLSSARGLYRTTARVREASGKLLSLEFTQPMCRLQRRSGSRLPCRLPATFRPTHSKTCFGAWMTAEVVDASYGGVRLHITPPADVPDRIDIRIHLPGEHAEVAPAAMKCNAGASEASYVRVTGRVCHRGVSLDGMIVLGVAYTAVPAVHRLRWASYVDALAADLAEAGPVAA